VPTAGGCSQQQCVPYFGGVKHLTTLCWVLAKKPLKTYNKASNKKKAMYLFPALFDQRGRKRQLKCAYKVKESQRLRDDDGYREIPPPPPRLGHGTSL